MKTGVRIEKYEVQVKRDFGSGKGAVVTGICQSWRGQDRGGGGGLLVATGEGEAQEYWYAST